MNIRAKIGWTFAAMSTVFTILFLYGSRNIDTGYDISTREQMTQLISAEYEARLADIQANITPLSVADLEMGNDR